MSGSQALARLSLMDWLGYHIERRKLDKLWRVGTRQAKRQWGRRRIKLLRKYGR